MSKLQPSADTIKKLGLTGIGIDEIGYELNLFHQLESKVKQHKVADSGSNSGTYYIEGDVADFLSGYTDFWITGRELIDSNIFNIDSATYDSNKLWTVVVVTTNANYLVNYKDVGFNICGAANITSIVKDLGQTANKLAEDGSIGNAVATTFDFTLNDEDRLYFNRITRNGFFYQKDIITEVKSVASESEFSAVSDIHTTFISVNNLSHNYKGSDFVNGYVELITGEAAGSRAVISSANGQNLKTLGFYAQSIDDIYDYNLKVKVGDKIRVFKADTFWFKLDMWVRSELDEKIGVVCGKLNLDTVDTNDKQRLLTVRGNSTVRDLFNKKLASLELDNGQSLNRLTEMRALMIDSVPLRLMKNLAREEIPNNPLESIKLTQVGFDVSEGWHIIDFNPMDNLFRFDLGRWVQIIDEGSFEKSTNSVFIASNDDAETFNNPAKLPAHDGIFKGTSTYYGNTEPAAPSLGDTWLHGANPTGHMSAFPNWRSVRMQIPLGFITAEFWFPIQPVFSERYYNDDDNLNYIFDGEVWTTDLDSVVNELMERNWHGKWGAISIDTEEDFHLGSTSNNSFGGANSYWKKLAGLPKFPFRMLVHVDSNRQLTFQSNYQYSYDNGGWIIPNYVFDYIESWDSNAADAWKDLTYALGFGAKIDYKSTAELPLEATDVTKNLNLRCYGQYKFDGILAYFRNEGNGDDISPLTFSNYVDSLFKSLRIRFTNGNGFSTDANLIYSGGTVSALVDDGQFTLTIDALNSDIESAAYSGMEDMWLVSISGDNFLQKNKISSINISSGTVVEYVLEDDFDNTVATGDLFVVLNKNVNLRLYDFGHTFKDGKIADVLAFKKDSLGLTANYRDVKYQDNDTALYGATFNIRPHDKVFIGHRSKFNEIFITMDSNAGLANNDPMNIAWYLRQSDFLVEYFDGTVWKTASDVNVIPTTVVGIYDAGAGSEEDRDDIIKYKISFQANDWHTGGYDSSLWTSASLTDAPSSIGEDSIYLIRMTLFTEITPLLRQFGISHNNEINLAIMWDNNRNWFPNYVDTKGGKIIADNLANSLNSIPLYGVELYCHDFAQYKMMTQVRPINKLTGYYGDSIYCAFDFTNIDQTVFSDAVISNPDTNTGLSHFPKNINFHYMMDKILDANGHRQGKRNLSFLDNFNIMGERKLSILGTGYDGTYPIDVGWDAALTNEQMEDYFLTSVGDEFRSTCLIRDNGLYRLYYIDENLDYVYMTTSTDLKTWGVAVQVTNPLAGGGQLIHIEVVRNQSEQRYGYYYTYRTSGGEYVIKFNQSTNPTTTISVHSSPTILSSGGDMMGKCSVLQLDNIVGSSANAIRLMVVEKFDGTSVDANDYPDGDVQVLQYYQDGVAETGAWTYVGERADVYNPCFIAANYCVVDGNNVANQGINNFTLLVKTSNNKLARAFTPSIATLFNAPVDITGGAAGIGTVRSILHGGWFGDDGHSKPEINDVYVDGWFNDIATTDFEYDNFSVLRDSTIYTYQNNGERAFTMVPFSSEVKMLVGVDDGNALNLDGIAIDNTINSWNQTVWYNDLAYEMNELDWWKSNQNNITFDNTDIGSEQHKRMYLGFRKPFNKIDLVPFTKDYTKLLNVRYWDGIAWQNLDYIYQGNKRREDSTAHITSGIHFETPLDWVADDFENIVGVYPDSFLDQKHQALYWIEVQADDAAETSLSMKMLKLCYTNTFMTKGRNLFLMENWTYAKSIYGYPFELDKKVKVDSISYDKEEKLILVNMVEDNPYEYRYLETMVFDAFGDFKTTYRTWAESPLIGTNQHISLFDNPESIYRKGYDIVAKSEDNFRSSIIGLWNANMVQGLYSSASIADVNTASGYNIPVPSSQLIRKYTIRGEAWTFSDSDLNNILIAHREDIITKPVNTISVNQDWDAMAFSLTNNGLLHEVLVNAPYFAAIPGFYAAMERSYIEWSSFENMTIQDFVTEAQRTASYTPDVGTNVIMTDGDFSGYISWGDGINWQYKLPVEGYVVYDDAAAEFKEYDGATWISKTADNIWPGRTNAVDVGDYGIGLEWTMGQEGIKIPYFRPWNSRPDIWANNNVFRFQESKLVIAYRHLNMSIDSNYGFGHNLKSDSTKAFYWFEKNQKPTCGVLLPDLTAIKNTELVLEPNQHRVDSHSPGIAFGWYGFVDENYDPDDNGWISLDKHIEDDFENGFIKDWWNDNATYNVTDDFDVENIAGGVNSGENMIQANGVGGTNNKAQVLPGTDGLIYGDFSLETEIQFETDFAGGNQSLHLSLISQDWFEDRDDVGTSTTMIDATWDNTNFGEASAAYRTPNADETAYSSSFGSTVVPYAPINWGTMKLRIQRVSGVIKVYYDIGGGWLSFQVSGSDGTVEYAKGVWIGIDGATHHGFRYVRFQAAEGLPDTKQASITQRYTDESTPISSFGNMGICLHKPYGKVQNWKQAWEYDGAAAYSDITDEMNYRDLDYNLSIGSNSIYLCSDSKFFSVALSKIDQYVNNFKIEAYTTSGWVDQDIDPIDEVYDFIGEYASDNDWSRKTVGQEFAWNTYFPWTTKTTINGVNGYWIRITYAGLPSDPNVINWITMSGVTLFDSQKWWLDYLNYLTSAKKPSSPWQDLDYRYFDTFVPISIEYDKVRKRLTGCLWNYASDVNEYYPFVIQFDKTQIHDVNDTDNWSWEVEYVEIIDGIKDVDYTKKIQSLSNVSPVSNKAILIDDGRPDGTGKIADIKNFSTGDNLFNQRLAPPA